jgi:hypothetical protein
MEQQNTLTKDPFLDVKKVPLVISGGQPSSRYAVVYDPDDKRIEVGVVSKDYRLIPNLKVKGIALALLKKTGLPFNERQVLFDGRKYLNRWTIDSMELEPRENDIVRLGLQVHNSYDGSTRFGLSFIAERLICSNGMVTDSILGGFRFRHYGENGLFDQELEQALETIRHLDEKGNLLLSIIRRMTETKIDRTDIQQTFRDLNLPKTYAADVFLTVEEDTEWGLYNAFTNVFTNLYSFRGEALNRQVSHYFFVNKQK